MKIIANLFCVILSLILTSVAWGKDAPRQAMKDGIRFYETKSYDRAVDSFNQAAQSAQQQKLDAAVARYNEANALFKIQKFGAAATNYLDAMRSPNLSLQSKAYYNRGNALAIGAESDEKGGRVDAAARSMDEALAMYENAMTLAPADEDAKINYELALKKKQELEQKQKQQQQNRQDQKQQKDQPQEQKDQKKDQQQKQDQQKSEQPQEKKDQQEQEQSQQQSADQPQQKQASPPKKSEEMTPEEARMMLDATKQEEQASRDRLRMVIGQPMPVDKDW